MLIGVWIFFNCINAIALVWGVAVLLERTRPTPASGKCEVCEHLRKVKDYGYICSFCHMNPTYAIKKCYKRNW